MQPQQSGPNKTATKTTRKSKRGKKPKANVTPAQESEQTAAKAPLVLDEKPTPPSTSVWSGPSFTDIVAGKAKVPTNVKKEAAKKEPGFF